MPASSKPSPSVRGPRPTATSTRSVLRVSPFSSDTVTPPSDCSTPLNLTPVLKLILRLRNARSSCLDERGILQRHEGGERLDDRDLGAERLPDRRELDADDAAADDDDVVGHLAHRQRLVAGDDPAADLEAGQRARVRAGGEHQVLAGVARAVDLDGAVADDLALALDDGDAGGLDHALQALVEPADDAVLVLVDLGHVDAVERALDAERGAFAGAVGDLGGVQEGLGGDAAVVQARAAELALLDEGDRQAELHRSKGTGVAAAAAPEHHDVEVVGVRRGVGHCRLPVRVLRIVILSPHWSTLPPG